MRRVIVLGVVLAAACTLLVAQASGGAPLTPDAPIGGGATGFLSECAPLPDVPKARCYIKGLLAEVETSPDPARHVPEIDAMVHEAGGFLEAACHSLMHEVGRTYAKRHDLTIETLYTYVPRSNDPGCSAGFGMGLSMYLGPKLIAEPRSLLRTCSRLSTRFREYTCVHGSGHAFMRGFHSQLRDAINACNELGRLNAPDCSQGAFHDYWISLGGGDGTSTPENADDSPESVCGAYTYKRPCWYRYFWERKADARVYKAGDMLALCDGLEGMQRAGCMSGASLLVSRERDPVDHARVCTELERCGHVQLPARAQRAGTRREGVRAAPPHPDLRRPAHDDPLVVLRMDRPDARGPDRRCVPRARVRPARAGARPRVLSSRRRPHVAAATDVLLTTSLQRRPAP